MNQRRASEIDLGVRWRPNMAVLSPVDSEALFQIEGCCAGRGGLEHRAL